MIRQFVTRHTRIAMKTFDILDNRQSLINRARFLLSSVLHARETDWKAWHAFRRTNPLTVSWSRKWYARTQTVLITHSSMARVICRNIVSMYLMQSFRGNSKRGVTLGNHGVGRVRALQCCSCRETWWIKLNNTGRSTCLPTLQFPTTPLALLQLAKLIVKHYYIVH